MSQNNDIEETGMIAWYANILGSNDGSERKIGHVPQGKQLIILTIEIQDTSGNNEDLNVTFQTYPSELQTESQFRQTFKIEHGNLILTHKTILTQLQQLWASADKNCSIAISGYLKDNYDVNTGGSGGIVYNSGVIQVNGKKGRVNLQINDLGGISDLNIGITQINEIIGGFAMDQTTLNHVLTCVQSGYGYKLALKPVSSIKTVNNVTPDASGNVNLTSEHISFIQNTVALNAIKGISDLGNVTAGQILMATGELSTSGYYTTKWGKLGTENLQYNGSDGDVYLGVQQQSSGSYVAEWKPISGIINGGLIVQSNGNAVTEKIINDGEASLKNIYLAKDTNILYHQEKTSNTYVKKPLTQTYVVGYLNNNEFYLSRTEIQGGGYNYYDKYPNQSNIIYYDKITQTMKYFSSSSFHDFKNVQNYENVTTLATNLLESESAYVIVDMATCNSRNFMFQTNSHNIKFYIDLLSLTPDYTKKYYFSVRLNYAFAVSIEWCTRYNGVELESNPIWNDANISDVFNPELTAGDYTINFYSYGGLNWFARVESDAPADDKMYGRKNGVWSEIVSGGGGGGTPLIIIDNTVV